MSRPLRALIVEDIEQDAALLLRALTKGGFDVDYIRVESEPEMRVALAGRTWDIIISDYSLPEFSALHAIETMRDMEVELPFIIVSGTVDEDTAVEAIRSGAHDFMAKGKFARLIPAIERELREAKAREEREKMRRQLLISDRMASIGTLAAGVAHEINNPLTAVVGGLELATQDIESVASSLTNLDRQMKAGKDPTQSLQETLRQALESLEDAREAADRVRLIVRDLRAFSRSDDETSGPVDVERAIEGSLRMVQNEVRHRARLIKNYGGVPPVEGNEARLGQVFLNLIVNAAQAMPESGVEKNTIEIRTSVQTDGQVLVEVQDNGPGIPAAMLGRIFDPFFTTKPIGKGTGLGLAICHRIISEMKGEIEVESKVGTGTTFRTRLRTSTTAGAGASEPPSSPPKSTGRVLVIDDEVQIGKMIARMLRSDHEVVLFTEPHRAVELLRSGEMFDAILCDLMMPDMSGMDFYDAIRHLEGDHVGRIAFMSGGAFTKEAREFLDRVRCPRLEKPFDQGSLLSVVHTLVRAARSR